MRSDVIGAALYHALGFNTTCEQVVLVRREQFRLSDRLSLTDNSGYVHPFDEKMLEHVLAQSARGPGGLVRMQASKWLPGVTIGPFSYSDVRGDDPNDVVEHQNRREHRAGRLLAAWIDHWDARSQNSMDVWVASDAARERSSPGVVKHFILDTSESFGGRSGGNDLTDRLGVSYEIDLPDIFGDLVTFGALSRPWDLRSETRGREKFGFFTARDFAPERWKPMYPNPAFERMTERDAAWMARLIAHVAPSELAALVDNGRFTDPSDASYLTSVLVARQRAILARYLTLLSPLGDVRVSYNDEVCTTDFARLRAVLPVDRFSYRAVERRGSRARELAIELRGTADVCIHLPHEALGRVRDDDPRRYARYEISNGTGSGPLVIFAYDREGLPPVVVGVSRPEPAH